VTSGLQHTCGTYKAFIQVSKHARVDFIYFLKGKNISGMWMFLLPLEIAQVMFLIQES
jgi:hypothetical protein